MCPIGFVCYCGNIHDFVEPAPCACVFQSMKLLLLVPFLFAVPGKLPLIDEFDHVVMARLTSPPARLGILDREPLGMSRIVSPDSYGKHFLPIISNSRDFIPQNGYEKELLAQLEEADLELGIYLFGESVMDQPATAMDYRSIKGPAVVTKATVRTNLPSWNTAYPLAEKAMKSFKDGGHGFEVHLDDWTIAARPAIANNVRCITCHNLRRANEWKPLKVGDAIGGVLYAYKTH